MKATDVIAMARKDGIDAPEIAEYLRSGSVEDAFLAMVAFADEGAVPVSPATAQGIRDVVATMRLREVLRVQLIPAVERIAARSLAQHVA